ncbi:hypothetical protein ACXYRQ_00050 [Mycoplasma sp. 394]
MIVYPLQEKINNAKMLTSDEENIKLRITEAILKNKEKDFAKQYNDSDVEDILEGLFKIAKQKQTNPLKTVREIIESKRYTNNERSIDWVNLQGFYNRTYNISNEYKNKFIINSYISEYQWKSLYSSFRSYVYNVISYRNFMQNIISKVATFISENLNRASDSFDAFIEASDSLPSQLAAPVKFAYALSQVIKEISQIKIPSESVKAYAEVIDQMFQKRVSMNLISDVLMKLYNKSSEVHWIYKISISYWIYHNEAYRLSVLANRYWSEAETKWINS